MGFNQVGSLRSREILYEVDSGEVGRLRSGGTLNEMHWLQQGGVFCVMSYNDNCGFAGYSRSYPKISIEKSDGEIFEFRKNVFIIGTARVKTPLNGHLPKN